MDLVLVVTDRRGQSRRAAVTAARFTIGSAQDNDLVIEAPGVARRHLVIECFEGLAQASDCGSDGGILLNGQPIVGAAVLSDRDLISLSSACEIEVCFESPVYPKADRPGPWQEAKANPAIRNIIGPLAALAAVITLVLLGRNLLTERRDTASTPQALSAPARPESADPASEGSSSSNEKQPFAESDSSRQIRRLAGQVMNRISRDARSYDFSDDLIKAVSQKVEQHRSAPALAEALRAIRRSGSELAAEVRSEMEPSLVFYTALAEVVTGQASRDPMSTARAVFLDLREVRKDIGTDTAESCLIAVAIYKMKKRSLAEILPRVGKAYKDAYRDRTVWRLHDRGEIDDRSYEFVLSFLAVGVIAQDPKPFGIAADPPL